MFNMQLWGKSGHAEKYKENMFALEVSFEIIDTIAIVYVEAIICLKVILQ